MLLTKECINLCRYPLNRINMDKLSEESTCKKVYCLVILSILNIVLVPIIGLIHLLATPCMMFSIFKLGSINICVGSSCFLLITNLLIIPIIGHILFNLLFKLIKKYDKQNSCLDSTLYFTLKPYDLVSKNIKYWILDK